jgi:hypothetical protein
MDLRLYYQKIRDTREHIAEPFAVVISHETQDGGKPGRLTEVSAALAARMIVEGTADLAAPAAAQAFRAACADARQRAQEAEAAAKVQVTLVRSADLERLTGTGSGPSKGQS